MGLSLDTPINFDVLLINTFITQLPVVSGELGCVSLAGVFERRFVISIATFELWFRETIVVFLGMIWGTDRCFVNNTLYSHAVSFQRAVFRFITVALTTSATYTLYIYISRLLHAKYIITISIRKCHVFTVSQVENLSCSEWTHCCAQCEISFSWCQSVFDGGSWLSG